MRLHTGDPSIYGAIQEQMAELDRLGIELRRGAGSHERMCRGGCAEAGADPAGGSQTVIITRLAGKTPVPERESLGEIAGIGATLVIYLSVGMIDRVVAELLAGGLSPDNPAAVVARASWPDEQVIEGTLADIADKVQEAGIGKQALIIVGDVLKARQEGLAALSRLYDKEFSHGCRDGMSADTDA